MTTAALRARTWSLTAVRAVPAWAWLAGIVVVSALLRFVLARRIVAPWIMVDELIYSELAKSFAATGDFLVRGEAASGYGIYPALISPAWRAFTSIPDAYEAAKAINSVLMSLAAVPAYFLARRVLQPALSLAAALLAVLVPSMAYTATLMTENAFYPAFLLAALALVLVLEAPTWRRQVLLLALVTAAFLIRAQAVALAPAVLTAPFLLAWLDGRRRALRDYRVLWGVALAAAVVLPLVQLARGRSLFSIFGAYEEVGRTEYSVGSVLKWLLYHVAELDLYLGVIPFAAMLVLLALGKRLTRRAQAFVAAATAITFWLLLEVAAFASRHPIPPRIEERNMFYVAPFFLIALLLWIDLGAARRHVAAGVAAVLAAALPGVLPYSTLIGVPATSDELALVFWWRLQDDVITLDSVATWAVVASSLAALAFLLVPRRWIAALPAIVVAWFVAVSWVVNDDVHGFRFAAVGALFQGISHSDRDWVDRAVGHDAEVAALWTTCSSRTCSRPWSVTDEKVIWENEFFSRSVGTVYTLHDPLPGGLPTREAHYDPTGGYLTSRGRRIHAQYVLTDASVEPVGRLVAEDAAKGISLYELAGPLRKATEIHGLYDDTWSGPRLTYLRRACRGGTVTASLQSDAALFRSPQMITARSGGRVVARVSVPPGAGAALSVRLRPQAGRCEVLFDVTPSKVPGGGDPRRLGIHFVALRYAPPPGA